MPGDICPVCQQESGYPWRCDNCGHDLVADDREAGRIQAWGADK